jgi:peptidoglycan hydrolase-like protein with peptidoglycan-binding domain
MAEIQLLEGFGSVTPISTQQTLSVGSKGDAVLALQKNLASWGFDPVQFDGIFGPNTKAAVEALQRKLGLTADGIVGPGTFTSISRDLASNSSVLKKNAASTSLTVARLPSTQSSIVPVEAGAVPFYQQSWFFPAVLGGAALLFLAFRKKQPAVAGTDFDSLDEELDGMIESHRKPRKAKRKPAKKKTKAKSKNAQEDEPAPVEPKPKRKRAPKKKIDSPPTDGPVVEVKVEPTP